MPHVFLQFPNPVCAVTFALWCTTAGVLLISMAIGASFLRRLPVSTPMLYAMVGCALRPAGLRLLEADPLAHAKLLEVMAEIVVPISLFVSGLKLRVPLRDTRWRLPLLLALVAMPLSIALIAAAGMRGLGLLGSHATRSQRSLMAWFGILGIGSICYLMFAINQGLEPALAQSLAGFTVVVVAASIVVHGISVTPVMRRYARKQRIAKHAGAPQGPGAG